MLICFANSSSKKKSTPIQFILKDDFPSWLKKQAPYIKKLADIHTISGRNRANTVNT